MRTLAPLAVLIAVLSGPASHAASVPLTAFKDHNPVILLFAASPEDARLTRETDEMAKLEAAPFYQSLIVVGVTGEIVMGTADTARSLRARFGVPARAFRVVLVDMAGATAFARDQVISVEGVKAAVDASVKRLNPAAQPPANLPPQAPPVAPFRRAIRPG